MMSANESVHPIMEDFTLTPASRWFFDPHCLLDFGKKYNVKVTDFTELKWGKKKKP